MTATLHRRPLTAALLESLLDAGKPVGDGVIPPGSAWSGEPNAPGSTFTPYLVLSTMTANTSSGPVGDPQGDWRLPYLVQSFGASREQAEWMADEARELAGGLRGQVLVLGADRYKVQQVYSASIGAVNRVDTYDPPYWGQQDQIVVWLTKEP